MTCAQTNGSGIAAGTVPPRQSFHASLCPAKIALSVDETARVLSIGRTTLYGLVKTGEIRATKIGRKTLFLKADIDAFLNRLQREGGVR